MEEYSGKRKVNIEEINDGDMKELVVRGDGDIKVKKVANSLSNSNGVLDSYVVTSKNDATEEEVSKKDAVKHETVAKNSESIDAGKLSPVQQQTVTAEPDSSRKAKSEAEAKSEIKARAEIKARSEIRVESETGAKAEIEEESELEAEPTTEAKPVRANATKEKKAGFDRTPHYSAKTEEELDDVEFIDIAPGYRKNGGSAKGGTFKILIPVAVAVLLCAGYIACCFAPGSDRVLGHTYVEATDLKGMNEAEAYEKIQSLFEDKYSDTTVAVSLGGKTYNTRVDSALVSPAKDITADAMSFGNGAFLTRGFDFVKSLVSSRTLALVPREIDHAVLGARIDETGIVEENSGSSSNWEIRDDNLVITKSKTKLEINAEELVSSLSDALLSGRFDETVECPYSEIPADVMDIQDIHNTVTVQPVDATLNPAQNYEIVESTRGVTFDLAKAQEMVNAAAEGDTVTIPLEYTDAEVTTEDLRDNLFRDVLGTYTTTVKGSADRRSNVRLAGEKCANIIMLPGDEFSYNDTVGQRTKDAGFKEAPAYQNGETVQELGGGVCQPSSTLYNAVMCANLEITERHNHSFASTYVPLGQDATVSWKGPDFKFRNNTKYPIKITESYEGDKMVFSILGTNVTGEYCKVTNETLSVNHYEVVQVPTFELLFGQTKRSVEGETGYKVKTYRHLYNAEGVELSCEEEDTSNYVRRDEVILVGMLVPGQPIPALPENPGM